MTPDTTDAIQQRRRLAQALMMQGSSAEPVQHWTQAAARVAQALSGSANMGYADTEAKAREKYDVGQEEAKRNEARGYAEGAMQRETAQRAKLASQYGFQQGTPEFNQFVLSGKMPDPNADLERQYKQAQIKKLLGVGGGDRPAILQEFDAVKGMSKDDADLYWRVKRADGWRDIGTGYQNPRTGEVINKNLAETEIQKGYGADVAKTRAELPETKLRTDMVTDGLTRLKSQADIVMKSPSLGSVVGGLYEAYVPNVRKGSLNAQTDLENLKTKISGVVLQSMRDMSKTGGAVGQVTEKEWPRLENMIANLDTRQSLPQFKMRLKEVMDYADRVTAQIQAAYQADLAKAQGAQMPGMAPQGGGPAAGWSMEPID